MKTVVLDEKTDSLIRPIKNLLNSLSRTHRILEKYTSEFVRESIQAGENPLNVRPKKTEAIVLFSDIVGSTSLAEFLPVDGFMPILDAFYEAASTEIIGAGGDVLKLTGDGLMARFRPDQADAAILAVVNFQKRLQQVRDNAQVDSPLRMLHAGIGMTCGNVLEGNIGSQSRRDYTLLGDVVNTAARLEAVTRQVRRGLVFDEAVRERLTKTERVKKLGLYRPKGKTAHLSIYSVDEPALVLTENSRTIKQTLKEQRLQAAG